MFSLGCIFYHLLIGDDPFDFMSEHKYLDQIKNVSCSFARANYRMNQKLKDLILQMIKEDPK